jgi:DNA-binding transcriptional regulator GbsR (MarR family)
VNAAASRFVEQLGVLLSAEGYPRVAGRLLGLLIVSPDAQSLGDLASQLDVSKASVSVNIRVLEEKGIVDRIGHSGDRRDYYRIVDDFLTRSVEQRLARWGRFHEAVRSARKSLASEPKVVRSRLHDLDSGYAHMITRTAAALKEWHARQPAAAVGGRSS